MDFTVLQGHGRSTRYSDIYYYKIEDGNLCVIRKATRALKEQEVHVYAAGQWEEVQVHG